MRRPGLARFTRRVSTACIVGAGLIVPTAGCVGCPDVDCGGGAPVIVSFSGLDAAVSAEICFDDDCAPATMSAYSNGGSTSDISMATRSLEGSGVRRGERFELTIRAFATGGAVVAERSVTRRRKDEGDCGCDGFGFRWDGETFADW